MTTLLQASTWVRQPSFAHGERNERKRGVVCVLPATPTLTPVCQQQRRRASHAWRGATEEWRPQRRSPDV